jgi:hypothetical protein
MTAAYRGHMKVSIFVFILAMLAGSVVAQENGASLSLTKASFKLDYRNNQMAARAIEERIIDRYVSFEASDGGRSSGYSVSLDLEHEDSDWNFEVTVTMEF